METLDKQKLMEYLLDNGDEADDTTDFERGFSACCQRLLDKIERGEFNAYSAN